MNRLNEGFAGYVNPYSGQKYLISLKPEDVLCFVFWSKNYAPFLDKLKAIEAMGYQFYFNYTITGLSHIFERRVNQLEYALDTLKRLSDSYSPTHINWRYDPILISNITPYDFHLKTFETIASKLDGYVERCYFSYAVQYGKVKRHFSQLQSDSDITVLEPDVKFKVKLANQLASVGWVEVRNPPFINKNVGCSETPTHPTFAN
jgi:hypothetical protein